VLLPHLLYQRGDCDGQGGGAVDLHYTTVILRRAYFTQWRSTHGGASHAVAPHTLYDAVGGEMIGSPVLVIVPHEIVFEIATAGKSGFMGILLERSGALKIGGVTPRLVGPGVFHAHMRVIEAPRARIRSTLHPEHLTLHTEPLHPEP
jgi:hypothetical protein